MNWQEIDEEIDQVPYDVFENHASYAEDVGLGTRLHDYVVPCTLFRTEPRKRTISVAF